MDFKGLSDFSNEKYLAGDQGKIVYLESTDDEFIFKKWFGNHLSKIEFKAVSGEKANGGCRVVIQKVGELSASELTPYYGIVDRDALLNTLHENEPLWWEIDDDKFFSSKPFGERVFVLGRWELENYLLHPEAILRRLENKTMGASGYNDASELAKDFIKNEGDLISISVLATSGRGDRSVRYGQRDSGQKLWEMVLNDSSLDENVMLEHKEKVSNFSEGCADYIQRWERLSRMLDGKRVMVRIDGITGQQLCLNAERGNLADDIANLGLIDENLKSWIERLV